MGSEMCIRDSPYAALFVALSFVTMCFVKHGDAKAEAKKGLEAFEDMDN